MRSCYAYLVIFIIRIMWRNEKQLSKMQIKPFKLTWRPLYYTVLAHLSFSIEYVLWINWQIGEVQSFNVELCTFTLSLRIKGKDKKKTHTHIRTYMNRLSEMLGHLRSILYMIYLQNNWNAIFNDNIYLSFLQIEIRVFINLIKYIFNSILI